MVRFGVNQYTIILYNSYYIKIYDVFTRGSFTILHYFYKEYNTS